MSILKYKTIGNVNPQGRPRVYFCCHPEDFERYFETVSDEILAKQNCSIWYVDGDTVRDEDFFVDLKQMQLFVMPVTTKLLCTENDALDIDFKFAMDNHIPVLPLMQESGLEELFNKKCGDLQFLDKNNKDATAIGYDEKLQKYLESVLIGDELAEKIRSAFDAYVFLSYRKKDRRYAQELMHLIHKNEFCRDIAIWYDEFLTPGENFNDSIKEALQKSGLFVMTVTPNLVNEDNYIMTTEYPMAKQEGKPILPAELVPTDREVLSEKYVDIPNPTDAHNETELSDALLESVKKMAIKENDNSPEHNFFIGLAYLGGVDVEVDYDRAVSLITNAAEEGLFEAVDKLYNMYLNGIGVKFDCELSAMWFSKKINILRENIKKNKSCQNYYDLLSEMDLLAQHYDKLLGNHSKAKKVYLEMAIICEEAYNNYKTFHFKRCWGSSLVHIAQSFIDEGEYSLATEKIEEAEALLKGIQEEQWKQITDNIETATIEQVISYYMSYNDMATLYEGLAELAGKNEQLEKKEECLLRCLELRKNVVKYFKEDDTPKVNVAASYCNLANHYKSTNDYKKAIEYCEKGYSIALEIANRTKNLYAGQISIQICMIRAEIHVAQNEIESAIQCYITNLFYLENSNLTTPLMKIKGENYYRVSKQYYSIENFEQAASFIIKYLNVCSQILDETEYAEIFGENLEYLTACNIKSGKIDEAVRIHKEFLQRLYSLYQQNASNMTAIIYSTKLHHIGDIYTQCQNYEQAKNYYDDALAFAKSIKSDFDDAGLTTLAILMKTYVKMAEMYSETNKKSEVQKCYNNAVKIAKKSFKRFKTAEAFCQLFQTFGKIGDWYKGEKRYKDALKCYANAINIAEKSVAIFQDEEDKYYLASLYFVAGTVDEKKQKCLWNKSLEMWIELVQIDPSSQKYQSGYATACQALNIEPDFNAQGLPECRSITLSDENGRAELYELLDIIVKDDNEYGVFLSEDNSETDVLILKIEESSEEEDKTIYSYVDDDIGLKIFDIFKKRNKDKFDFFD